MAATQEWVHIDLAARTPVRAPEAVTLAFPEHDEGEGEVALEVVLVAGEEAEGEVHHLDLHPPPEDVDHLAGAAGRDKRGLDRLAAGGLTVLVSTHYMDEAERCHRISYISYGKMLATGTVEEVVRDAGLTTFVVRGPGLEKIARELAGRDGVDQVAPFGTTLHVVGADEDLLETALEDIRARHGVTVERGETSLEDVFIQFMAGSKDNMG